MEALQNLVSVVILPILFIVVSRTQNQKIMKTVFMDKFHIVGISTRTTNANGQSAMDIENLWKKFWGEEIQKKIPNKVSDDIYAVYTEYESDFKGAYTTTIGLPVLSLENIPPDFVGITIKAAEYQEFISKGRMPEAVFNTWVQIWNDHDLDRAYTADFTVHGKKYYEGNRAEVTTYISINR